MGNWAQRWASTLANRSNARRWSNIRAPPRPIPPDVRIQSVGICEARGAGSDSWLAGVSGCHIFVPAPHAPPPKGLGQRSKVVILPTTATDPSPLVFDIFSPSLLCTSLLRVMIATCKPPVSLLLKRRSRFLKFSNFPSKNTHSSFYISYG